MLGLGVPPTVRLQRTFSTPGEINRFERLLVWCHWMWFFVPHASVGYVLARAPERFPAAAARMYAVFDIGRRLLLGDPHRAAVVGGRPRPTSSPARRCTCGG